MDVILTLFAWADGIFRWDGWRALAALGTFAAVWVALRRDAVSERRTAIKEAHLIGAIIGEAEAVNLLAKKYETERSNDKRMQGLLEFYDEMGGLDQEVEVLKSIKFSECPTVEVMTTRSVLSKEFELVRSAYEKLRCYIADKKSPPPSLKESIVSLDQSISDLNSELKVVSGRFYAWAHQDGHRQKVDEKINGTPRTRALRALPEIVISAVTNRQPKSSAAKNSRN